MSEFANTTKPPYYAVIFTSLRTAGDNGYQQMAERMAQLVQDQPGFLGMESAREELGITVSYWSSLEAIRKWKDNAEHQEARNLGRRQWYSGFQVRIARVERDYRI